MLIMMCGRIWLIATLAASGESMGKCPGHYIAYFKRGLTWYLADDDTVNELRTPPTECPYVVLLLRIDKLVGRHISALQNRVAWIRKSIM